MSHELLELDRPADEAQFVKWLTPAAFVAGLDDVARGAFPASSGGAVPVRHPARGSDGRSIRQNAMTSLRDASYAFLPDSILSSMLASATLTN